MKDEMFYLKRLHISLLDYCPYKWEEWGGNCLDISELTGMTNEARLHCQKIGGSLAIVENRKQHNYLQSKMALGAMTTTPLGCTNGDNATWSCIGKSYEEWFWYNETHNAGFWSKFHCLAVKHINL